MKSKVQRENQEPKIQHNIIDTILVLTLLFCTRKFSITDLIQTNVGMLQNCFHTKKQHAVVKQTLCFLFWTVSFKNACSRQGHVYLIVGMAFWVEGWKWWSGNLLLPLSLCVRPSLVIKGNLGRFYLRCIKWAQYETTLSDCGTENGPPIIQAVIKMSRFHKYCVFAKCQMYCVICSYNYCSTIVKYFYKYLMKWWQKRCSSRVFGNEMEKEKMEEKEDAEAGTGCLDHLSQPWARSCTCGHAHTPTYAQTHTHT